MKKLLLKFGLLLGLSMLAPITGHAQASCGGTNQIPCTLGWYTVPNTALSALNPGYSDIQGTGGQPAVLTAWGSATFNTQENCLIVHGGGHVDYYGNEIYSICFDTKPPSIHLVHDASHGAAIANLGSCPEAFSDGNPNARHDYNGWLYLPTQNAYFLNGAGLSICGNFSDGDWFYYAGDNLSQTPNTWLNVTPATHPNSGSDGSIPGNAYDPITDAIYEMQGNAPAFWRFTPASKTWTQLATPGRCGSDDYTAAIDPDRRLYFCLGGGSFDQISLNSPYIDANIAGTTTGCSSFVSINAPGFTYYAPYKVFVIWDGGNDYWTFNPDTLTCTKNTYGAFTGGPTQAVASGQFGMFGYAPTLGAFYSINSMTSNISILRLHSPSTLATQDWNKRLAATGTLNSQAFDSNAFLSQTDPNKNNASVYNCTNSNYTPPTTCPQTFYDTSHFASGTGSMRMDIPGMSGSLASGYWYMYIDPSINATHPGFGQNSDWWVQFHIMGNTELFDTDWESVAGTTYKHFIQHQAFPDFGSCSNVELTDVQASSNQPPSTPNNRPYPGAYTQCGALPFQDMTTQNNSDGFSCNGTIICNQQGDYWCPYNQFPAADCLTWAQQPNTWLVETVHVHFGTSGGSNSKYESWLNQPGRPKRKFMYMPNLNLVFDAGCPGTWASGNDCYYQVIDFLLYGTNAIMAAHPTASMWIDELWTGSAQPLDVMAPAVDSSASGPVLPQPPTNVVATPE